MTAPEWIIAVALPVQLACLVGTIRNARATKRSLERTAATWRRVAEKTAQTNALLLEMTEKVGGSDD